MQLIQKAPGGARRLLRGNETLVVFDGDPVKRQATSSTLARYGYRVLTVVHARDALTLIRALKKPAVDLLITNLVLGSQSGYDLVSAARASNLELKALLISGPTSHSVDTTYRSSPHVSFLREPFSPVELASKVREVLDAST